MDPLGAEINIDQFLFGVQNPYALSNNSKLSLILKGQDLKIVNQGLETSLVKDADMKKFEAPDAK